MTDLTSAKPSMKELVNTYVMLAKTGRPEIDYDGITNVIIDLFASTIEQIAKESLPVKRSEHLDEAYNGGATDKTHEDWGYNQAHREISETLLTLAKLIREGDNT